MKSAPWKMLMVPSSCIALCLVLSANLSHAAEADWPCEQIWVPEIAAAVVWDGPSIDGLQPHWRNLPKVKRLVKRLTSRHADPAKAEATIEQFAQSQAPPTKDAMLTQVFAGVWQTLNRDRVHLMKGIKRYSRDQARRARILGDHLSEMVALETDASEPAKKRLQKLTAQIELEQRLFDDREKSIQYLCTRPVAVEQRLGALARIIAGYLD